MRQPSDFSMLHILEVPGFGLLNGPILVSNTFFNLNLRDNVSYLNIWLPHELYSLVLG